MDQRESGGLATLALVDRYITGAASGEKEVSSGD